MRLRISRRILTQNMRNFRSTLYVCWRGIQLIVASGTGAFASYCAIVLAFSIIPVVQVWLSKQVMNTLVTRDLVHALSFAGCYALTQVIPSALLPLQGRLQAWLGNHLVVEVDRQMMRIGAQLVDLGQIERAEFQENVRFIGDNSWITNKLFHVLSEGIGPLLTLIGLFTLLAHLHPLLPVVLVILTVPYFLAARRLLRMSVDAIVRKSRAAREMDYCARITTDLFAAKEVRVFGLGAFFLERFRERFAAALTEVTRLRLQDLRLSIVFIGLHAVALAGGFWYVAREAGIGRLTPGDVALYINALVQLEALILPLRISFGLAYTGMLYFHKLFDLMDAAHPAISLAPTDQALSAPAELRSGIELSGVAFSYSGNAYRVLEDVSFKLPAGKVTALVGANGAGKSTIVKLLSRMYDPDQGQILLDNVPLQRYDLARLRSHIAVLYQDFARFSLTLRENIAVGATTLQPTDSRVEEAARWSGADEVARKLPDGYATELTRRFAGGVDLSGGEWQKVALARAFVRDATIVILDEPTAALDADAEYRLFEHFRTLVKGKTALMISHRFSTVRMADHIVVLEQGRIIEVGSHTELIARGGRYAALFAIQAERYM